MNKHEVVRRRMEVKRREIRVANKQYVTPGMLRIGFVSPELRDFESYSADDHIKILIPTAGEPVRRDFTPRAMDPAAGTLTLDFALHARGPAMDWARNAVVGDVLGIAGPKGSATVPDDFDWYLLVGDGTALPSIGRRVEGLRPDAPVEVFAVVDSAADEQHFETRARCHTHWVHRGGSREAESAALRGLLEGFVFPPGDGYVWIAAETGVARALFRYLTAERGHPKEWTKAAGYWTEGAADGGEKIA